MGIDAMKRLGNIATGLLLAVVLVVAFVPVLIQFCISWAKEKQR